MREKKEGGGFLNVQGVGGDWQRPPGLAGPARPLCLIYIYCSVGVGPDLTGNWQVIEIRIIITTGLALPLFSLFRWHGAMAIFFYFLYYLVCLLV